MSAVDDVAEVLAEHDVWDGDASNGFTCEGCGHRLGGPTDDLDARHLQHVAQSLAEAGLLRVDGEIEWASAIAEDMKPGPALTEAEARGQVTDWNLALNRTSPRSQTDRRAVLLQRTVTPWTEVPS